jgi:hypothetical protein
MPIKYSLDIERGLSAHVCTKSVCADDIIQAINALYLDPGYSHSYHSIWDFRKCEVDLSADDIRRIVSYEERNLTGPGGKVALVVGSDLYFGLARMYNLLSEQKMERPLMVFRDHDKALRWIENSGNE